MSDIEDEMNSFTAEAMFEVVEQMNPKEVMAEIREAAEKGETNTIIFKSANWDCEKTRVVCNWMHDRGFRTKFDDGYTRVYWDGVDERDDY